MDLRGSIHDWNDLRPKSRTPGKSWEFMFPTGSALSPAIRQEPPTSFVFVGKRTC
jgi:hypothetical protein